MFKHKIDTESIRRRITKEYLSDMEVYRICDAYDAALKEIERLKQEIKDMKPYLREDPEGL